jgi:ribosomal protein L37E
VEVDGDVICFDEEVWYGQAGAGGGGGRILEGDVAGMNGDKNKTCIRCGDRAVLVGHTWKCKACGFEWMTIEAQWEDGIVCRTYTGYWKAMFTDQPDTWMDVPNGCLLIVNDEELKK